MQRFSAKFKVIIVHILSPEKPDTYITITKSVMITIFGKLHVHVVAIIHYTYCRLRDFDIM